jgi:hypothetical protein
MKELCDNKAFKLPGPGDWPPFLLKMANQHEKRVVAHHHVKNRIEKKSSRQRPSSTAAPRNINLFKEYYRFTAQILGSLFPNIKDILTPADTDIFMRLNVKGTSVICFHKFQNVM